MHRLFNLSSVFICLMAILLLFVLSSTSNACVNCDAAVIELGSVDIEVDNTQAYNFEESKVIICMPFFSVEDNSVTFEKDKIITIPDKTLYNLICTSENTVIKNSLTVIITKNKEAFGNLYLNVLKLPVV